MYYDSQSVIHLSKNHMFHEMTKYIDVIIHSIKDMITKGELWNNLIQVGNYITTL